MTSHAAQGRTANDVVAVMDLKERGLTSQVGFYVSISRSADTLALVVDDKERVLNTLQRQTGLKASAMETEGRMRDLTDLGTHQGTGTTSNLSVPASAAEQRNEATGNEQDSPLDQDLSL